MLELNDYDFSFLRAFRSLKNFRVVILVISKIIAIFYYVLSPVNNLVQKFVRENGMKQVRVSTFLYTELNLLGDTLD